MNWMQPSPSPSWLIPLDSISWLPRPSLLLPFWSIWIFLVAGPRPKKKKICFRKNKEIKEKNEENRCSGRLSRRRQCETRFLLSSTSSKFKLLSWILAFPSALLSSLQVSQWSPSMRNLCLLCFISISISHSLFLRILVSSICWIRAFF